jgi:hypothetical protein
MYEGTDLEEYMSEIRAQVCARCVERPPHDEVCLHCASRNTTQCPCPLETLLILAVQAIEAVDQRRSDQVLSVPQN